MAPMRRRPRQPANARSASGGVGEAASARARVSQLRVFAMEPGLTARFETAVMNEMTLRLPWEDLEPGPAGEYVVVVDEDQNGKHTTIRWT